MKRKPKADRADGESESECGSPLLVDVGSRGRRESSLYTHCDEDEGNEEDGQRRRSSQPHAEGGAHHRTTGALREPVAVEEEGLKPIRAGLSHMDKAHAEGVKDEGVEEGLDEDLHVDVEVDHPAVFDQGHQNEDDREDVEQHLQR